MELIIGATVILFGLTIFYLQGKKNENLPKVIPTSPVPTLFKWSILIKTHGKVYLESEGNDLGKIGFHIYTNLVQSIDTHSIYIRDNSSNELMRIDKDYESESMIGVNHPEHGHIGYLPFTIVDSIR